MSDFPRAFIRYGVSLVVLGMAAPTATSAAPASGLVEGVGVLITFDQARIGPNVRCDGRIRTPGPDGIREVRPVLFEPGETVTGASWRCRTRGTREQPGGRGRCS